MSVHIEPIANASGFIGLPTFQSQQAAEHYLEQKGFIYTEDISMQDVVMLLMWDEDQEKQPHADGESLKLFVMPILERA